VTWTYDPTMLATNQVYQVRFTIGDTLSADPQLQDEEIAFALSMRSSIYGASADCCRAISAGFARAVDGSQGAQRTTYSSKSRAYAARAAQFDNLAVSRGGAMPFAGGISIADKIMQECDPDRVSPQFQIGMEDNYLPAGIAGNEGTSDAAGTVATGSESA
jgi:hypothetical protein